MKIEGTGSIVFGAAQGIGRAYAEILLEKGGHVCIADILEQEGRKTEEELQKRYSKQAVFFTKCDICNETQIKDVFDKATERFGNVCIVANNCGIIHEFDWQKCIDVNLGGNIRLINTCREILGKNKGGQGGVYVATSSISGLRQECWGPVYSASKHAIVALIKSWAEPENFKDHGIRMNCICPTRVKTPFLNQVREDRMYHAKEHIELEAQDKDSFSPEDVAKALVMLIEDDTANGKVMRVTRAFGFDFATFQEHPIQ